jgi:DNA-binding transcriptional LysR family regulator
MVLSMQASDPLGVRFNLRDLHILMTVVQAGSMSRAAKILNTVQPVVSRSIAELEHALGVRLLDRGRHGVKPTEYGRALLDGGTAVFDDLRQTIKNIEFLADPTVGNVRVGCNPFLAASFVSAVVHRVAQQSPGIAFHLETGYAVELSDHLDERNVDLLITRPMRPVADERVAFEFLFEDSYSIVVGAQHPWARRRSIELADLMDQQWVLPSPGNSTGAVSMEAFRKIGRGYPPKTVVVDLFAVRISLLLTGPFISVFPASVLKFSAVGAGLNVLSMKRPLGRTQVGIVTLKNRAIRPPVQTFIDGCRKLAKEVSKRAT